MAPIKGSSIPLAPPAQAQNRYKSILFLERISAAE